MSDNSEQAATGKTKESQGSPSQTSTEGGSAGDPGKGKYLDPSRFTINKKLPPKPAKRWH